VALQRRLRFAHVLGTDRPDFRGGKLRSPIYADLAICDSRHEGLKVWPPFFWAHVRTAAQEPRDWLRGLDHVVHASGFGLHQLRQQSLFSSAEIARKVPGPPLFIAEANLGRVLYGAGTLQCEHEPALGTQIPFKCDRA
jgi:hypothetical protein